MVNLLVDVGACVGEFTDSWLRLNPEGHAVCIEPHPDNFATLKEKYGEDENVKVLNLAVGLEAGPVSFYFGTTHENGSLCVENESQVAIQFGVDEGVWPEMKSTSVECVCIKDLLDKVSLYDACVTLKIDIEGLEFRVLDTLSDEEMPQVLYIEDSCSKSRNRDEWRARLSFFERIERIGTGNINFEKRPPDKKEYALNYVNVAQHRLFQRRNDIDTLRRPIMSTAVSLAQAVFEQNTQLDFDYVYFPFYMTNCHNIVGHTSSGEELTHQNPDPLFPAGDADWLVEMVKSIKIMRDLTPLYTAIEMS